MMFYWAANINTWNEHASDELVKTLIWNDVKPATSIC